MLDSQREVAHQLTTTQNLLLGRTAPGSPTPRPRGRIEARRSRSPEDTEDEEEFRRFREERSRRRDVYRRR
ncbi:hypothetical protein ACJQWK_09640 [Exserohilum turcicum]